MWYGHVVDDSVLLYRLVVPVVLQYRIISNIGASKK